MKTKQIHFFLELEDMKPIIESIESKESIKYFKCGHFNDLNVPVYNTFFELEDLGFVSNGDWNHNCSFLMLSSLNQVKPREIALRNGGKKYAIDQMLNIDSIVIKPGGILQKGILVAGSIGTISSSKFSLNLFDLVSKAIKKNSRRIGSFYIGPEARSHLEQGWRLVTNKASPEEYDLKLK